MKLQQWFFLAYTATLFLLSGLSPLPFLAAGFFLALLALFLFFAMPSATSLLKFRRDDAVFGFLYLLGLLPLFVNPSAIREQNFEYAALWLVIWLVCFWWVREWALNSRVSFPSISKAAAVGAVILSMGVTFEFVMVNTTGLYLSDILPFSTDRFPFARMLGTQFIRPRGFSVEPGFSAIVFDCLLPLSAQFFLANPRRLIIGAALIAPGFLLLGSAAALVCLAITTAVFLLVINRSLVVLLLSSAVVAVIGFAFVVSDNLQQLFREIIGRKIDALFDPLSTDGATYSRSEAYRFGFRILREHPFGIGWGEFSQRYNSGEIIANEVPRGSGLLSVPLEIGVAGGFIAAGLFFYLLYRKLKPLMQIDTLPARLVFFSLVWTALHHMVVLELWFPMLWFSLALADVLRIRATASHREFRSNHREIALPRRLPQRTTGL